MNPEQYCQDKAARSGSSFYYSFLFLAPERRAAITALYAFCREVDDVVDETADGQIAATKLAWWRAEVDRLHAGHPQHPVTRSLHTAILRYPLEREHMLDVIDGMAMDLTQNRYPDFAGLGLYCYRVAGVVGLMAAGIFGQTLPQTSEYARNLGTAFQLTNIIRDVGEDARRGRIYLPQDELQRFGVSEADLLAGRYSDAFTALMAFQIDRARQYYARAFAALPAEDRKAQRAGLIMAAIYQALLDEIERAGGRVLHQRISLTPLRKLWLAWKTWAFA